MKIGIIGAMVEEIELMKDAMNIKEEIVHAKISFYVGTYKEKDIILCKSGVGKVNATITTQVLIDRFHVDKILFTGVAGALDSQLEIGDIVISNNAQHHDIDASPLGFTRGEIPMFDHSSIFPADNSLVKIALSAANDADIQGKAIVGKIVSGDQFIANQDVVKELHETFEGTCVEMEGAAVAQAAMLNDVPFVIIRSISDKANGEANMSFTEFVKLAAKQSNQMVSAMLQKI